MSMLGMTAMVRVGSEPERTSAEVSAPSPEVPDHVHRTCVCTETSLIVDHLRARGGHRADLRPVPACRARGQGHHCGRGGVRLAVTADSLAMGWGERPGGGDAHPRQSHRQCRPRRRRRARSGRRLCPARRHRTRSRSRVRHRCHSALRGHRSGGGELGAAGRSDDLYRQALRCRGPPQRPAPLHPFPAFWDRDTVGQSDLEWQLRNL